MEAQLDELKTTYNQLCDSSTQQLQQLEQQLAKEEERKVDRFGWGGPSGEKGVCRFMANMYSAYASLNKNNHKGTFIKCSLSLNIFASEAGVYMWASKLSSMLFSMLCVHRFAFLKNITSVDECHSLTWFGLTNTDGSCSDVYSDPL